MTIEEKLKEEKLKMFVERFDSKDFILVSLKEKMK